MTQSQLGMALLSLLLLLSAAQIFGFIATLFRLPKVAGELGAGLLMGPTFFGNHWPSLHASLFNSFPGHPTFLSTFQWIGLIFLMFVAGFHLDRGAMTKDGRLIGVLGSLSFVIPFALGMAFALMFEFRDLRGIGSTDTAFALILASSMAVTSLPVISRIFSELGLMGSRFAGVVLTASSLKDVVIWGFVAVATSLASSGVSGAAWSYAPLTIVFVVVGLTLGTLLLRRLRSIEFLRPALEASPIGYALTLCLTFVVLSLLLGVNVIFGALVAGVTFALAGEGTFKETKKVISSFVDSFFAPLYFALVGLAIDLPSHLSISGLSLYALGSSAIVVATVALGLSLYGINKWKSIAYALTINARGGPGIVIASVALAFEIISAQFFVTLVATSILTSVVAGHWLRYQLNRDARVLL